MRGWLFLYFAPERYLPPILLLTSVMMITRELTSNTRASSGPSTDAMGLTDLMMEYLCTVAFSELIIKCQSGGFCHLWETEGEVFC